MSADATSFLYPFIEADETDATSLLEDLAASARAKIALSRELRDRTLAVYANELSSAADAAAERFERGARAFSFGNGGSAADAAGVVQLFGDASNARSLPAMSLAHEPAVVTALANDIGVDVVFERQLRARASEIDIAIGFSTSGGSTNVLRAFAAAHDLGLLTIGLCGYDGGEMATSSSIDHCFVVDSDSVHRIQESQDAMVATLLDNIQDRLRGGK